MLYSDTDFLYHKLIDITITKCVIDEFVKLNTPAILTFSYFCVPIYNRIKTDKK